MKTLFTKIGTTVITTTFRLFKRIEGSYEVRMVLPKFIRISGFEVDKRHVCVTYKGSSPLR